MTQYINIIEEQKEKLKQEQFDNSISFIEVRFKDSKWTTETTGYNSGRVVIKYNDKRRKDKIENEI
tara:strand:- start:609 stop:806 length:198 start_codon:yes stop_codon:yes gene_type:complete